MLAPPEGGVGPLQLRDPRGLCPSRGPESERSEPPQRPRTRSGIYSVFGPVCPWLDAVYARLALDVLSGAQALLAGPGLFENFRGRSAALRLAACG